MDRSCCPISCWDRRGQAHHNETVKNSARTDCPIKQCEQVKEGAEATEHQHSLETLIDEITNLGKHYWSFCRNAVAGPTPGEPFKAEL
jgi:hypothetical protein